MLFVQFLGGLTLNTVVFTALILGPAWAVTGRLDWPRGWLAVGIMFLASALGGLWFVLTDPGLVRERAAVPRAQSRADTLATLLIGLAMLVWIAAASVDGGHLHLLPSLLPAMAITVGIAFFLAGLAVIVWTMQVNSFAASVVKVQSERHQRVIDTGPYAFVRHPMYFGSIPFLMGMALVMDSTTLALAALPVFVLAFLPRIAIEEATLSRDLEGYADYQARVRWRILPGLL
jgi:protein-S-isoprenylcysteine O-methyltransferase Ste14